MAKQPDYTLPGKALRVLRKLHIYAVSCNIMKDVDMVMFDGEYMRDDIDLPE